MRESNDMQGLKENADLFLKGRTKAYVRMHVCTTRPRVHKHLPPGGVALSGSGRGGKGRLRWGWDYLNCS